MTTSKDKFLEKAVNKFIEMVLTRLINADRVQVRVKANLKDLLTGKLDALTIEMFGFMLRRHLRVAEFQFNIGTAAVNLESVRRRKIELLYPSEGSLRLAIAQEQLITFLNAELAYLFSEQQREIQLQEVNCELREDGAIAFHFHWLRDRKVETGSYITIPQIEPNGNVAVISRSDMEVNKIPDEFISATLTQITNILNLTDLADRGTTFQIQQLDIEAGKITVQAHAYIEQVPSN